MFKQKAFTLIELIVVITILAILGTIAFISLQGYSKTARDSVRISDMKNIEKGLELQLTKAGKVSIPEDKIDITASGILIAYQGYAGKKVLNNIGVHGGGKDPIDEKHYTYMINSNLTKYQILGYLEGEEGLSLFKKSYATDFSKRYPNVLGSQLGVLLQSGSLNPVQDAGLGIDIVNTVDEYVAYLDSENIVSGTGLQLFTGIYNGSEEYLNDKELAKFDENLVLYFDMETVFSSGGVDYLKDFSSYGNIGECYHDYILVNCGVGGYGPQFVKGINKGKALYFNGANDRIEVNKYNFLGLPTSDFTILSVIKTEDTLGQRCIVSTTGNGTSGFRYGYGLGQSYFLYSGHIENNIGGTEKINNNKFNYLVEIFDLGNSITAYINGKYSNTYDISSYNYGNVGALNQSQYIAIGTMGLSSSVPITGIVDELRIYNRKLSEKEIQTLYNSLK